MSMNIICPKCSTSAQLPDHAAGKTVRCGKCGSTFQAAMEILADQPNDEPGLTATRSAPAGKSNKRASGHLASIPKRSGNTTRSRPPVRGPVAARRSRRGGGPHSKPNNVLFGVAIAAVSLLAVFLLFGGRASAPTPRESAKNALDAKKDQPIENVPSKSASPGNPNQRTYPSEEKAIKEEKAGNLEKAVELYFAAVEEAEKQNDADKAKKLGEKANTLMKNRTLDIRGEVNEFRAKHPESTKAAKDAGKSEESIPKVVEVTCPNCKGSGSTMGFSELFRVNGEIWASSRYSAAEYYAERLNDAELEKRANSQGSTGAWSSFVVPKDQWQIVVFTDGTWGVGRKPGEIRCRNCDGTGTISR